MAASSLVHRASNKGGGGRCCHPVMGLQGNNKLKEVGDSTMADARQSELPGNGVRLNYKGAVPHARATW